MYLTNILRDPNFNRVAAIIRRVFWGRWWKANHPTVPFWTLLENVNDALRIKDKHGVLDTLTVMLRTIADADERLRYSMEDIDWLVRTLDEDDWHMRIGMLLGFASAVDVLYTPAELAAVTGLDERTWRYRAEEMPGAIKKGKQWLIPKTLLTSLGMLTDEQVAQLSGDLMDDDEEDVQ